MPVQLDVIEFEDPTNRSIVARIPANGSAEIKYGAELIVHQNQEAVFFRNGEAMDVFGPGRHTLNADSVPLLTRILTLPWRRAPFRALVYFVGKQTFVDQKWGTRQPIVFEDKTFGVVRLRSYGRYSFRVVESTVLINRLVGTKGLYSTEEVTAYMRDLIIARMTDLLGSIHVDVVDLPAKFDEISAAARAKLSEDFSKYGLELVDFFVNSITPPEEVQQAIDAGAGDRLSQEFNIPDGRDTSGEDPRSLVDRVAKSAGWEIRTNGNSCTIRVAIGPLRRQVVNVRFDRSDNEGHKIVSFSSVCGHAAEETAMALLRYNAKMAHAAFAIESAGTGEMIVVEANQLTSTADELEVRRSIAAVAWQADQAEQQLMGQRDEF